MGGGGVPEEIRRMLAYVDVLRRIGEHRRENVFLAGHRTKKKCFSFVQEIRENVFLAGHQGQGAERRRTRSPEGTERPSGCPAHPPRVRRALSGAGP